jgi:tetratricopeptide (TPR) repeat protein
VPARRKEAAMKLAWNVASRQALLLVVGIVLVHGVAGAAGGGGGGDAGNARQDPALATAVQLIQTRQYERAVPLLEDVIRRDPRNADAYNWLAYATRKNGDPAKAIPIYQKALDLDPRHLGAHEYIGEAYLALDDLAHAKEHLKRLDKLCLFSCEEYRDLKKAVQAYEKSNGAVKPAAAR